MEALIGGVVFTTVLQGLQQGASLAVQNWNSSSDCNQCCQNQRTYAQACAAHYTLGQVDKKLSDCIVKLELSTPTVFAEIQSDLEELSETITAARQNVKERRSSLPLTLGVQGILLILVLLFVIFMVIRRSARRENNLDEIQWQIESLQHANK